MGTASAVGEREQLMGAMALVAGRQGYRAARIGAVIEEAGSSRASFDRHFADKEECFGAAHEFLLGRTLDTVGVSFEAPRPWLERVSAGLRKTVELATRRPELARAMLVEPAAVGAEGLRCAQETIERFAELITPEPELAEGVPPRAALMAVSGVAGLIGDQLAHGEAAGLTGLLPELTFALLVPLVGPIVASEQMSRVATGARA